ncbi:MAG: Enolase C-terminal domain-like [Planctomycetota bacterium]
MDPSQLSTLANSTGIAIALDESVVDRSPGARALRAQLARDGVVSAWVLRMSAIGALDDVYAMAADAAEHQADVVLSTAYESSYTLRLAVHVAAAIPNARRAHGLGTAHLLVTDSCAPALVRDGKLAGDPLPIPLAEAWE